MTRDEQERAIVAAAIAHVSAQGCCEDVPFDYDEHDGPYCYSETCTYCALARTMEGYELGDRIPSPSHDPLAVTRTCAACGRQTRITTAGCDNCDVEDK